MPEEKYYKAKIKDGAHMNENVREDGSRAALQFDENNCLQGPVDLIEVDKSELIPEIPTMPEQTSGDNNQAMLSESRQTDNGLAGILIDALWEPVIEPVVDTLTEYAIGKSVDFVQHTIVPKAAVLKDQAKGWAVSKIKKIKTNRKKIANANTATTTSMQVATVENSVEQKKVNTAEEHAVYHTPEEIRKIQNNMKYAALYIAAGIKELSHTVLVDDINDPQVVLKMQSKWAELSSADVSETIDFLLSDENSVALDQATTELFRAFRHNELIVNGEYVPISNYLTEPLGDQ